MSKKITITVDLDEVYTLVDDVAKDNEGLETSSGLTPDDLDRALEVLVRGPSMTDFRNLLQEIVTIHHEVHDKRK